MRQARKDSASASTAWLRATFWDEVEREIEGLGWEDFVEFLEADRQQVPIRAEFRGELRVKLHDFVKTRYST